MEGVNRAILAGHLGLDPELKYTQDGRAILRFRLATSESYVDLNGERKDRTDWHTVVVWGKRAEALSNILVKGQAVFVEGRIQTRSWEDKDGTKRYATEVKVSNLSLLDRYDGQKRPTSAGQTDAVGAAEQPGQKDYDA